MLVAPGNRHQAILSKALWAGYELCCVYVFLIAHLADSEESELPKGP